LKISRKKKKAKNDSLKKSSFRRWEQVRMEDQGGVTPKEEQNTVHEKRKECKKSDHLNQRNLKNY